MGFEETFRSVALTICRTIIFTAHAYLFGAPLILLFVLRPAYQRLSDTWAEGSARVAARLEGMTQAALTASAVGTAVALVLQAALVSEATGGSVDESSITAALGTRFGQLYLLRFPLLTGLAVLLSRHVKAWAFAGAVDDRKPPGRGWWGGWLGISAALMLTSSMSGHAAVARPVPVSVANDLLHLGTGAAWFVGVVVLAIVLPEAWRGRPEDRLQLLAPVVTRFSQVALITFSIVGITGIVNAYFHLEELDDLWNTGYGKAISMKLILYALVLAIGALNHFVVRERLEEKRVMGDLTPAQTFRKTIAVELALALLVFGVSGLLTGLARTRVEDIPDSTPSGDTAQVVRVAGDR